MISKEQAFATVFDLMRKEGMIPIWQVEVQVDGVSAVFIGTDVVSHEKAALVGEHLEGGHGR